MRFDRNPTGFRARYLDTLTGQTADHLAGVCGRHEPDTAALLEWIVFGDLARERTTFFADVERIGPSWSPPPVDIVDRTPRMLVPQFWRTFVDAVERAVGDAADVVVALSGGLDSVAIATALVERRGPQRVRAVTAGEQDEEEVRLARGVARHLGIGHELVPSSEALADWPDNPYWPAVPRLSSDIAWERAVTGGAVVAWGVGGDTLLRGDREHYAERWRRGELRAALRDAFGAVVVHGRKPALGLQRALGRRSSPLVLPEWLANAARAQARELVEARTARYEGTRRGVDGMGAPTWSFFFEWMAPEHNDPPIRNVFPFFDVPLIELVATIPTVPWCIDKEVLRSALRGRVPEEVRLRPKSPLHEEPCILLDGAWAARLREAVRELPPGLVDVAAVRAALVPGRHSLSSMHPLLRCASAGRWHARLTDGRQSRTVLAR